MNKRTAKKIIKNYSNPKVKNSIQTITKAIFKCDPSQLKTEDRQHFTQHYYKTQWEYKSIDEFDPSTHRKLVEEASRRGGTYHKNIIYMDCEDLSLSSDEIEELNERLKQHCKMQAREKGISIDPAKCQECGIDVFEQNNNDLCYKLPEKSEEDKIKWSFDITHGISTTPDPRSKIYPWLKNHPIINDK